MREDNEKLLGTLQEVCRQQHEEIEKKRIQISDYEEENRVLRKRAEMLLDQNSRLENRIRELEEWCGHLQNCIDEEEKEKAYHRSRIRELEEWTAKLEEERAALEKNRTGFISRVKSWLGKCLRGEKYHGE